MGGRAGIPGVHDHRSLADGDRPGAALLEDFDHVRHHARSGDRHLGKTVARVQKTILGLMKTAAPEGIFSSPCESDTARRTDSRAFS